MAGEVTGHFSRLLLQLRVAAGLALLMGGLSIAGWWLYVRADRARDEAQRGRDEAEKALVSASTASRPDLEEKIAGLQTELSASQSRLTETQRQRDEAETARLAAEKARASAEADAAGEKQARLAAEAKATVAETGRAAAEARAAAAETARTAAEAAQAGTATALAAAERTIRELEARLASAEQARATAEAKAGELDRARAAEQTRALDAERQLAAMQQQLARLTEDVQGYRRDLDAAREAQRHLQQRLEQAMSAVPATMPAPATGEHATLAATPAIAEALAPATQPLSGEPAAVVIDPASWPTAPSPEAAFRADARAPVDIRVPLAAPPTPEALAAASPNDDAPAIAFFNSGEYQLVKGEAAIAVELIQRAIAKGGEQPDFLKSLGWALLRAGRPEEAKAALEKVLAGFERQSPPPATANPDHWTAAYLLGRVDGETFARRWKDDARFGARLACLPWFYIGQRREMEGHLHEARAAYRMSVELGRAPNAYPIWRWSAQRLSALETLPMTHPAQ